MFSGVLLSKITFAMLLSCCENKYPTTPKHGLAIAYDHARLHPSIFDYFRFCANLGEGEGVKSVEFIRSVTLSMGGLKTGTKATNTKPKCFYLVLRHLGRPACIEMPHDLSFP